MPRVSTSGIALALAAWMLLCHAGGAGEFTQLNGAQIRSVLRGNFVGDGRHWEHHYRADARLTRHESGREKTGRWSVQGDRLCILKPEISTSEPACFHVHRKANELQYVDGPRAVYEGFVRNGAPRKKR